MSVKKFLIFLVCILVSWLVFIIPDSIYAAPICTTITQGSQAGWITCQDSPSSPRVRATTCDQLSGIGSQTCGAGSGCGLTGCYNCASQGNCGGGGTTPQGNSCPVGYVWNDCATGDNTCVPGEKWSDCKTGSNNIQCRTEYDGCAIDTRTYETCPNCWNTSCWSDTCQGGMRCTNSNCRSEWYFTCTARDEWTGECWDGYWDVGEVCDQDCNWSNCASGSSGGCNTQCSGTKQCQTGGECQGGDKQICTGENTCKGGYSWDNCANNGTNTCRGGCVPLPCNSVAPSVPYLVSPVGNANVSGTVATLSLVVDSYGTPCAGGNTNQVNIYVNQCDTLTPATTLWKTTANTSEVYIGLGGKGYCWAAEATNGVTTSARSITERWNFSDQPWWQVSGGGVMAIGGISSMVNSGKTLIKDSPAVLVSGGEVDLNGQQASSTNWQANDPTAISTKLNYRYDYWEARSRVLATIRPVILSGELNSTSQLDSFGAPPDSMEYGVYYVQVNGNLNINTPLDLGDQKIVILVDGDVTIKDTINFNDNTGLFALLAKGDITVDSVVGSETGGVDPDTLSAHLEGIFLAGGSFNTGSGSKQLRIEGPVIGMSSVNFGRQLNSSWPNEYVVFRPDIILNLPKQLLRQNHLWREARP